MAAHVHRVQAVVDDVGASLEEGVDVAVDLLLVPGHRVGGENHRVALVDGDDGMGAMRHPRQR